jgi:hypothetical protein
VPRLLKCVCDGEEDLRFCVGRDPKEESEAITIKCSMYNSVMEDGK